MAYIQNVSYHDIVKGNFPFNNGDILIQIVDEGLEFPHSTKPFYEILQLDFCDVDSETDEAWEFRMTEIQAKAIADKLKSALKLDKNIIVHCVAGVCRSGAVVEVGTMLGFEDTGVYRQPNVHVKKLLMKELDMIPDYYEQ